MKKVLIIYPHFPPGNLAGVHRPRLFAQHLSSFNWEPTVLTVHEDFYEEAADHNLVKLLPHQLRIEKVKAFKVTQPRLVGDIGLRAFFQLYKKARQLIKEEHYDFLYISIPSFYTALLGRRLHESTGIPYGIDYIDPWVHEFPGSDKLFSRHWFSTKLAKMLEPVAVKKASLITGVAEGYYQSVLDRNPTLRESAIAAAMPYGGEEQDHALLKEMDLKPYLFTKKKNTIQLVYAGAMLPKAYSLLEEIFKAIKQAPAKFEDIEFHFIGTGKTPNDPFGYNIKPLAETYGLWKKNVYEYPARIPYLDVLIHLEHADAVFILGSTEPHYTPSKSYQAVLSSKPILAVLHRESTAVGVLEQSGAAMVIKFDGEKEIEKAGAGMAAEIIRFKGFVAGFKPSQVDKKMFDKYSAKNITRQLALLLDQALEKTNASP